LLNAQFAGANQAYLDSYAYKLDVLTVAAENAKETIGKGLFEGLSATGGGGASGFDTFTKVIDAAAKGVALLLSTMGKTTGAIALFAQGKSGSATDLILGRKPADRSGIIPSIGAELKKAAADKAAAKARAAMVKSTKAQTAAIKEQTALQKAGTLFDIQQAGIIAALKGKITDEERTRLELQLAILTGNTVEASKLAEQLGKAQGLTESLRKYLADVPSAKNPFEAWKLYLDAIEAQARRIAGITPAAPVSIAGGNTSGVFSPAVQEMIAASTPSAGVSAGGDVNVYVAGSVVSEADLVEAVSNGLLNRSLSGSPSAVGRLKGSFTA
jgi:hypothetical protein